MGLRGSGKTTAGPLLASRLSRPFIDLDDLTPRELDEPHVAAAWANHGEPAFRKAEAAALRRVLGAQNQVIALGGGTPTEPGAAALLLDAQGRNTARLIYLRAGAASLQARLCADQRDHRPSLTGTDPIAEVPEVLARRDPLYLRLADGVLEVDRRTPAEVADEVARLLDL